MIYSRFHQRYSTTQSLFPNWIQWWAKSLHHAKTTSSRSVKTLQGLGVLDMSMVAVDASVQWVQWVGGSEEGEKPELDRGWEDSSGLQVKDEDKTKV